MVAAAVVAATLLSVPSPAAAEDPPFLDWNPLLPGLPQPYQPSKDADCVDGDPACIERTLTEMYQRFDRRYATCDHNSAFGLTYIRVTEAIRKAILDGVYQEPRYLGHVDRVFARMYFEASDAWRAGKRDRVPAAWREAQVFAGVREVLVEAGNLDPAEITRQTGFARTSGWHDTGSGLRRSGRVFEARPTMNSAPAPSPPGTASAPRPLPGPARRRTAPPPRTRAGGPASPGRRRARGLR